MCGDFIMITDRYTNYERVFTGWECLNVSCNAAWDEDGCVVRESSLTTDPESVD